MRLIVVLTALTLFGCSDDYEPQSERDAGVIDAPASRPYPEMPEKSAQSGDTMCRKTERVVFHLDDAGLTVAYDVPLPCDPFWKLKDRGDPAP